MVTRETVIAECNAFLEEIFKERGAELADVPHDAHLVRRGFLDSMEMLELVSVLEEKFDVEFDFSGEDPDKIMTMNGLVAYCQARR
ncbi:MAG: acyl carrier protein [Pseudodesulfovibrio sp.]